MKHTGIIRHLIGCGAVLSDDVIARYPDTVGKMLDEDTKTVFTDDEDSVKRTIEKVN